MESSISSHMCLHLCDHHVRQPTDHPTGREAPSGLFPGLTPSQSRPRADSHRRSLVLPLSDLHVRGATQSVFLCLASSAQRHVCEPTVPLWVALAPSLCSVETNYPPAPTAAGHRGVVSEAATHTAFKPSWTFVFISPGQLSRVRVAGM